MQIGLIYIGEKKSLIDCAKVFSKELANKNNMTNLFNGIVDNPRLGGYPYLVFFIESDGFFSKKYIEKLNKFFSDAGFISAKYGSVYTNKALGADRKLQKYMKRVEKEGIIIHDSRIIGDVAEAEYYAKQLEPVK